MKPETNGYKDKYFEEKITAIQKDIEGLRTSYKILNDHSDSMQRTMDKTQTDLDWIKRFFWIIASTSVGALVTGIINIMIQR